MSTKFDYSPHLSDETLATLHLALEFWFVKYTQVPRPRGIYWDDSLDKRDLGGHYVGLTNKVFLNPNQDLKELLRSLFHELHHLKRWHEGGSNLWLEKGMPLFGDYIPREEEEKLVDSRAIADREEFLKLSEPEKENEVSQHNKS